MIDLIARIAAMDPMVPSEVTGDPYCFFCGYDALLGGDHEEDCAWVEACETVRPS